MPEQYCRNCGTGLSAHARFCWECGTPIIKPPTSKRAPKQSGPGWWRRRSERQILGIIVGIVLLGGVGGILGVTLPGNEDESVSDASSVTSAGTPTTGIATTSPSTFTGASSNTTTTAGAFVSENGEIGFTLDKVERSQTWPADWTTSNLPSGVAAERPSPETGHDFVIVQVTIVFIRDGHIVPTAGTVLAATDGTRYDYEAESWQGIEFKDPNNMAAGYEVLPGSIGKFIYELPLSAEPATLEIAYQFFESWSESWEPISPQTRHAEIDID